MNTILYFMALEHKNGIFKQLSFVYERNIIGKNADIVKTASGPNGEKRGHVGLPQHFFL